jgi:hypothetical protein
MKYRIIASLLVFFVWFGYAIGADTPIKPGTPQPTHANILFGPYAHQLLDFYLRSQGKGPFPAMLWFGGI